MFRVKKYNNTTVQIISIFYIFTILILMMDKVDVFPFGNILRKIKYVYLMAVFLYFIGNFRGIICTKVARLVMFLVLHTVLFGCVYVNFSVIEMTHYHFREMMIYIAMVVFTYFFVWNENIFHDFLKWNYWGTAIFLLWCGVTHISHFVNPLYFIYVFSSKHTYRTTFGLGHANFTGNICLFALIYSVFLLENIRRDRSLKELLGNKEALWIICVDIIIGEMLFSTQSRTSILAGIAFCVVYIYCHWRQLLKLSYKLRYVLTIAVCILIFVYLIGGGASVLWSNSNRDANITVNYPIFQKFSSWTGMGYIPSSGFYTNAYGLDTFALDIYYLYIFFTTGYMGSGIMMAFLVLTLLYIMRISDKNKKILVLALFISMLVTGIGQTNLISYALLPSMINLIIIFWALSPEVYKLERK